MKLAKQLFSFFKSFNRQEIAANHAREAKRCRPRVMRTRLDVGVSLRTLRTVLQPCPKTDKALLSSID